jgi:multidrug efflux pump subunit AcrB
VGGGNPNVPPKRIRLDQVATITDTVAEPRAAALLDGKPVVGFEVARSRGASEVEVGAAVRAALADLQTAHPDMELTESFDFVTPVKEEFDGSMVLLYEGAILAVIVVWLFLRDWRATFVSAVALPLSAIPAFIGMHYLGFSINVVSLLALSLVIGILVDDAIVEVENIERHLRMGKTPFQAAMEAADEIGLAVIATTFTLIAVFLPTAFMSGIAGKFFKQFGWTAALAVFASLVVARMLTPMMAAYIMHAFFGRALEHQRPPRAVVDAALPRVGQLVPEAPPHHRRGCHRVLRGLGDADSAAAHGLHSARRQLADPGLPGAAARLHAQRHDGHRRAARVLLTRISEVRSVSTPPSVAAGGHRSVCRQAAVPRPARPR